MGHVRDGVVNGISNVVYELAMEEKYQKSAMRALEDGMRHVSAQFEAYTAASGGSKPGAGSTATNTTEIGFWEPPRFDEEVCCMKGMDCWTGEFANAAGRAAIIADIEKFSEEMVEAKDLYDVLNAENEREAAALRAVALADARDAAARLTNQIKDAEKREQKAQASNDSDAIRTA